MKVLLVNPGHPQTFWSFNRVLEMLGKKALMPPLGLLTVAALLPPEWDARFRDLTFQAISPQDWDDCDLLFVSGMIVQHRGIIQAIKEGKRRGKTVVVGGPWAFHFAEDALAAGADLAVTGEAELVMPQLLDSLERHESGKVLIASGHADLKHSPLPRFDLIDLDSYLDMALQFSRGCPFHCEFCDITLMLGRRVRTKTTRQILEELQVLDDLGWRGNVFFVDDNFIGSPPKAKDLLRELIPWMGARGHPFDFFTQASVNLAADPELLDLMVRAGFTSVFLGIETTDVDSLVGAGKMQNATVDLKRLAAASAGRDFRSPQAASWVSTRKNPAPTSGCWTLPSGLTSPSCSSPCCKRDREPTCGTVWSGKVAFSPRPMSIFPTRPA